MSLIFKLIAGILATVSAILLVDLPGWPCPIAAGVSQHRVEDVLDHVIDMTETDELLATFDMPRAIPLPDRSGTPRAYVRNWHWAQW